MFPVGGEIKREAVVARLWQDHLDAEFPARLRGAELESIDMVVLDVDVVSCVTTWRNGGGSPDAERRLILHNCITKLDKVLPPSRARKRSGTTSACTNWRCSPRRPAHT
ncbi:hypothetical protein [Streptomyces apocyni]|uniref:hypothetical protein n=1 Tax=Streptomyces apocyni TaxID=2654677 RepID=UPI0018D1AB68|nr:hypothetical protein [Streptomyces apocyni]